MERAELSLADESFDCNHSHQMCSKQPGTTRHKALGANGGRVLKAWRPPTDCCLCFSAFPFLGGEHDESKQTFQKRYRVQSCATAGGQRNSCWRRSSYWNFTLFLACRHRPADPAAPSRTRSLKRRYPGLPPHLLNRALRAAVALREKTHLMLLGLSFPVGVRVMARRAQAKQPATLLEKSLSSRRNVSGTFQARAKQTRQT